METLKDYFKKLKWDSIVISIITIVFGSLCIALPDRAGDILCKAFGISLIFVGVMCFIRYFAYDTLLGEKELILALITSVLGIFCLVYPNSVQSILTVLVGAYIVIDASVSLTDSIACAKMQVRGWSVLFILSFITIMLGISVMFSSFETVVVFAGISLLIAGIERLVFTICYSHKIKQAKKDLKDKGIID